MATVTALVKPYSWVRDLERRAALREPSNKEALTRALDGDRTLAWGATVRDISTGGIGLTLCYPFRAGAYLSIDIVEANGAARTHLARTHLARVVHAVDQKDGTWHVGCEFIKSLAETEL